jgi:DNA helicase-2/ATP-dependent DNA helicase PcrA
MSTEYVLHSPAPRHESGIDYAAALNPEQLAAVQAAPGPILVIAGAGSGKTRTLTYRVAYLIDNGVEPENILLLTFTNKAAREMLHRVGSLLPHDISRMWGGTFHHVGHRLLRRHANLLGFGTDFTIMDADDAEDLAASCLAVAGLDPKDSRTPKGSVLLDMFGLAINKEVPLREIIRDQYPFFDQLADSLDVVMRVYTERKKNNNVMDYDDLLSLTLRLLRDNAELRERYQNQFQHILVDEYQDTSKVQSDLVDTLAALHKQVMVVGDDAQSIYSWRGANFENILHFPKRYEGATVIRIETNYRSSPEILNLANYAIAANKNQFAKNLRAARPADRAPKPALVTLQNGNQQAAFVAQRIGELYEEGVELKDIAVLYRSHFHTLELQMELTRRNIPYEVTSGIRFFEQAHIKDVSSYLKLAVNPKDELAFKRIAATLPGVGAKTAEKLWQQILAGKPMEKIEPPAKAKQAWEQWSQTQKQLSDAKLANAPSDQIKLVVDAVYEDYIKGKYPNHQSRLEDLTQLRAFAQSFATTAEFLAELSLLTNVDGGPQPVAENKSDSDDKVRLSTVHQAKGLEWKVVFVIMLNEGQFPSARALENPDNIEEERRLFYVAVTRARDELYLTYPMIRDIAGSGGERWQEPSRFIEDLSKELVNPWKITPAKPAWS